MIDVTIKAIENRLKADLNGWLEHDAKYPSGSRYFLKNKDVSICNVFEQTMKYYQDNAELAKEALHNVLLHSFTKKEEYNTDFDVPRFENSFQGYQYADLIDHFKLEIYLVRDLWKMESKSALELLGELYVGDVGGVHRFSMCDKIFIQLSLDEDCDMEYQRWEDILHAKFQWPTTPMLHHLLTTAYECLKSIIHKWERNKIWPRTATERLIDLILFFVSSYKAGRADPSVPEKLFFHNTIILILEMAREVDYENKQAREVLAASFNSENASAELVIPQYGTEKELMQNKRPLSLKEYMMNQRKENDITDHEHVFATIVSYICQGTIPNQQDEVNSLSTEEEVAMERLENYMKEKHSNRPHMMGIYLKCIYIIRRREMFWKSILKVMVQFLDLWIGGIEEARCADIVSSWISHENLLPFVYKHITKHVRHYQVDDNLAFTEKIKKLTWLFEKCLDHVETNEELLLLRDYVFENRDEREEVPMPILGLMVFWNIPFEQEMMKVTNQITSFEEDVQVPEEMIRRLIKLSVIWPYEVLRQLFLSSIQNKNQYKAIMPVLKALGNLCILKKQETDQLPLLLLILSKTISTKHIEIVENHKENLIQFIKSCCTPTRFQSEFPLILLPSSMVDQSLLPLEGILDCCVLQNLSTSCHTVLLEFSLHALNSFCESSLNDWTALMKTSDLPGFLYCSPETYLISLTNILALRSTRDETGLPLQDYELALRFVSKLSDILIFALNTQQFPCIRAFFTENLEYNYDWKTQLLWYHITCRLTKHSLKVPNHLFRITGALGNVFTKDEALILTITDINEGWYELLTACRMSTCLTDELFEHVDQWTYNLLLLWKHPNEDTLLLKCLQQVLHPKTSSSVSIEYKNLLVHFLTKLYDSFPGVHQVIQEYGELGEAQLLAFPRNLTETGTKLYFIVLYTTLLINRQLEDGLTVGDKQDNYFVSNLVYVLQGLTNWGNISQDATVKVSYNELKITGAKSIQKLLEKEGVQATSDEPIEPKTLEYPLLNTAELISDRALSILTLYHVCVLSSKVKDEYQQQSLNRLMLLIIEGLIDMPSQQIFQRMLQQQPKTRHKLWKQKKSSTKFIMKMRPIIDTKEESLLRPVIDGLPNSNQILQALGLTESHKEQYLYFLN